MKREDIEVTGIRYENNQYYIAYRYKSSGNCYTTYITDCTDELNAYNKFMRHMEAIGITTGDKHGI